MGGGGGGGAELGKEILKLIFPKNRNDDIFYEVFAQLQNQLLCSY